MALLPKLVCPACWPAYAGVFSSLGLGFVNYNPYLFPLPARVKTIPLRSLLRPGRVPEIGDRDYYFCPTPGCYTAYFTEDGIKTFYKGDLTVRVGIKEPSPPRPVCYCFDHTVEEIFKEVERSGKCTVAADIRRRITEDGCSCETKKPQGTCCLGTVESYAREAIAGYGQKRSAETNPDSG